MAKKGKKKKRTLLPSEASGGEGKRKTIWLLVVAFIMFGSVLAVWTYTATAPPPTTNEEGSPPEEPQEQPGYLLPITEYMASVAANITSIEPEIIITAYSNSAANEFTLETKLNEMRGVSNVTVNTQINKDPAIQWLYRHDITLLLNETSYIEGLVTKEIPDTFPNVNFIQYALSAQVTVPETVSATSSRTGEMETLNLAGQNTGVTAMVSLKAREGSSVRGMLYVKEIGSRDKRELIFGESLMVSEQLVAYMTATIEHIYPQMVLTMLNTDKGAAELSEALENTEGVEKVGFLQSAGNNTYLAVLNLTNYTMADRTAFLIGYELGVQVLDKSLMAELSDLPALVNFTDAATGARYPIDLNFYKDNLTVYVYTYSGEGKRAQFSVTLQKADGEGAAMAAYQTGGVVQPKYDQELVATTTATVTFLRNVFIIKAEGAINDPDFLDEAELRQEMESLGLTVNSISFDTTTGRLTVNTNYTAAVPPVENVRSILTERNFIKPQLYVTGYVDLPRTLAIEYELPEALRTAAFARLQPEAIVGKKVTVDVEFTVYFGKYVTTLKVEESDLDTLI
jgi:hypothetical protein